MNYGRHPTVLGYSKLTDEAQYPNYKVFILPIAEILRLHETTRINIRITCRTPVPESEVVTNIIWN